MCISYKNQRLCIEIQNKAPTTTLTFDDLEVRQTSMSSYIDLLKGVVVGATTTTSRPPRGHRRYNNATMAQRIISQIHLHKILWLESKSIQEQEK